MEQLRKLQETLRRKYTCDRSSTVTRLEDLLQDAQVSTPPRPWPAQGSAVMRGFLRPGGMWQVAVGIQDGAAQADAGVEVVGCRVGRELAEAGSASGLHGYFVRVPLGAETR